MNSRPTSFGGTQPAAVPALSALWGREGELWRPDGRLPDFSFAGCRHDEGAIPELPVTADVTAFGARGDGIHDDTTAFLAAIAATPAGALFVPPGRYVITRVLRITRPGVVLRGAGMDRTTLYFPTPLSDIEPDWGATTAGVRTSNYSWSGGFVRFEGDLRSETLTAVTAPARRGDDHITVAETGRLAVGQVVDIHVADSADNTLACHLYTEDAGDVSRLGGKTKSSLVTRILGIEGDVVRLERPLRNDLRPGWNPVVRAFAPTVTGSGAEDLTFEFPDVPYPGHFKELGFNPLAFVGVAHCRARRLRFRNADSGPFVGGVFNTVSDVVYESCRAPDENGCQGHHGASFGEIGDHLFTRFDIRMKFIHDVTVSRCAGVVVSRGQGENLCFDHHCSTPHQNLFTDIDLGEGSRPWTCGGGAWLGRHAAGYSTFWGLRARRTLPAPPADFGPWSLNLVGVNLGLADATIEGERWVEAADGRGVQPANLHEAQRAHRPRCVARARVNETSLDPQLR